MRAPLFPLLALILGLCGTSLAEEDSSATARLLIQDALGVYQGIRSYEVMLEREYHHPEQSDKIFMHFEKPDILFMEWIGGEGRDRQLLYAPHAFESKLQVRPPGLFFRFIPIVELDKNDPRILKAENRSIDRAGIGPFLEKFSADFFAAEGSGKIKDLKAGRGEPSAIDVTFDDPSREYPRVKILFDRNSGLPAKIELYRPGAAEPDVYVYSDWNLDGARGDLLGKRLDPRMKTYLVKARMESTVSNIEQRP